MLTTESTEVRRSSLAIVIGSAMLMASLTFGVASASAEETTAKIPAVANAGFDLVEPARSADVDAGTLSLRSAEQLPPASTIVNFRLNAGAATLVCSWVDSNKRARNVKFSRTTAFRFQPVRGSTDLLRG